MLETPDRNDYYDHLMELRVGSHAPLPSCSPGSLDHFAIAQNFE